MLLLWRGPLAPNLPTSSWRKARGRSQTLGTWWVGTGGLGDLLTPVPPYTPPPPRLFDFILSFILL